MANPEHLKILKQGSQQWNAWRVENIGVVPDLSGAELQNSSLSGFDFSAANLRLVKLNEANLAGADFSRCDLLHATLIAANLVQAQFCDANLRHGKMYFANFEGAFLDRTNFSGSQLKEANFRNAALNSTAFKNTDLSRADFSQAFLLDGDFSESIVAGANFSSAIFSRTLLGNMDLSKAVGLMAAIHVGPSIIGIDTLYKSKGEIPDEFLRSCGVPEEIIDLAREIRAGPPIQWCSCRACPRN